MAKELPTRQEVPVEMTWDLSTIFPDDAAWEKEYAALEELIPTCEQYKGRLAESSTTLKEAITLIEELSNRVMKVYQYTHLNEDTDTANPHYQAMGKKSISLYTDLAAATSFFNAEMMEADEAVIMGYINDDKDLNIYHHDFEILFSHRPHILSEKEENILAQAGEPLSTASKTFSVLNNADMVFPVIENDKGEKVQLSHGSYVTFLESQNPETRKAGFDAMYDTYKGFKNTLATTLAGEVSNHNFNAKVRGYNSAREAALFNNSIPETVYDALIEAVNDRLPLLHRYVDLRQKALGVEEITMADMYVPMVEETDLSFTIEDGKQMILEALAPLGEEYVSILQRAFDERWIDWTENKGKRSGAYSSGTYGTTPYILMNWQDNLDNIYTLAHELGHTVHSYYTRNFQPFVYGNYSIFLAEIASTTNENLLTDYLLKKYDDPKVQAYVINHYLDGVKGTVFRQTQFAEFEHLIHESARTGTPLTAEFLTNSYFDLNKKYYGDAVKYDERIGYEWSRIPHFYMNYYVYQYATGFSAANTFAHKILTEGQPAVDKYIEYLKAGCSDYPIEVLKKAGVDMTTNQATIDTLGIFEQRLNELEAIVDNK